jgi:hypothetical protein
MKKIIIILLLTLALLSLHAYNFKENTGFGIDLGTQHCWYKTDLNEISSERDIETEFSLAYDANVFMQNKINKHFGCQTSLGFDFFSAKENRNSQASINGEENRITIGYKKYSINTSFSIQYYLINSLTFGVGGNLSAPVSDLKNTLKYPGSPEGTWDLEKKYLTKIQKSLLMQVSYDIKPFVVSIKCLYGFDKEITGLMYMDKQYSRKIGLSLGYKFL